MVSYKLFKDDAPDGVEWGSVVAVDTETLGLIPARDRLCTVQLCTASGQILIVQTKDYTKATNLRALMEDPSICKLFHFARFDVAMIQHHLSCEVRNIYCTKVASKIARCNTERHSLGELCSCFVGKRLSKESQRSDWGAETLTQQQLVYAASDVIYLHEIKNALDVLLEREGRTDLFNKVCSFLSACVQMDLMQTDYRYIIEH